MNVDTVDENAQYTDMQGPSSGLNELAGRASWASSPTKSLVALWFAILGAYWFVGWFFKGQRS
jgi:hypothetical protein